MQSGVDQDAVRIGLGCGQDRVRMRSGIPATGWFMHQWAGSAERGGGEREHGARSGVQAGHFSVPMFFCRDVWFLTSDFWLPDFFVFYSSHRSSFIFHPLSLHFPIVIIT